MFYVLSSVVLSKTGNRVLAPVLPPTVSSPVRCLLDRVSSEVYVFVIFPMSLSQPWHTAWKVKVHFLKQTAAGQLKVPVFYITVIKYAGFKEVSFMRVFRIILR